MNSKIITKMQDSEHRIRIRNPKDAKSMTECEI